MEKMQQRKAVPVVEEIAPAPSPQVKKKSKKGKKK
jgi:hypothetical protein